MGTLRWATKSIGGGMWANLMGRFLGGALGGILACWLGLLLGTARAAETLPPAPGAYFNDYAGVVAKESVNRLNASLEQYEKDTSIQLVVAVFPKLPDNAALEDYTEKIFQAWKVGQKGKDNGAILFVFTQSRRLRIEVGYGLEGVLTDALCKRVIEEQITPRFRQGDYTGGLTAGTMALMQAAKGEYKGTGRTAAGNKRRQGPPWPFAIFVIVMVLLSFLSSIRRGRVYGRSGVSTWNGGWSGGGGWSSGGGGFGGGGFSGGGGSSGGGGASGSW